MKLMIFGATGGTGARLLDQALEAGHDVTILARNPTSISRENVTVLQGNVLNPRPWQSLVAGQDAVLSCLGSIDRKHATTVYSEGTANILAAIRSGGVRRLICLSSAGLDIAPETPLAQRLVTRLVIQRIYRHGYADMAKMENLVTASDTDWTVIRPPMLTNGPLRAEYRTAANAHLTNPKSISRADLAHYILNHINDQDTWKNIVEISQ
jgi:putative NADH-flavin reductase